MTTYTAIATDYDGTIAHDGVVDAATNDALRRARDAGLRLILVTGRELNDLFNTFAGTDVFDLVVAENGAVLFEPRTKDVRMLAPPPSAVLVEALTKANAPMSVGHTIVATVEPHDRILLETIRESRLPWQVIYNKGSVMALPAGINKATGLGVALNQLLQLPAGTIGVGDAENDHAFLSMCGLAVAVANALESVKLAADLVTEGARGEGVAELIEMVIAGRMAGVSPRRQGAV